MTIVESIKCVLQQNNDGLTSKQIYDEIIRQGLYSFGAENPVGVVNAQLRRRCIGLDFPTAYPIKFFEIAGYEGKKIKFRLISTENTATIITAPKTTDISELLPEEKIKAALQEHLQNIRQQVFDSVLNNSPEFFEHLVVDLLLKMGYGYDKNSGIVTGKPHDGGIDGIISEDKLGLDLIYIQAKRFAKAFEELEELRAQANRLDTRFKTNEEKLIKAGGEKARELQERIEELIRLISIARDELERIESKDENDASLTEENNLHKADQKFKYYEQEIAKATRTNTALRKKELVDSLVNEIKLQATTALKQEIVRKTNEKLRRVIVDDYVEIESIDRYIKLKGRDGASEGQTLSIAYCFLGTLFEDSELEFPFIIDSPTGKMDFEKRQAVADIIPLVFNQMIAFVQSAEVERFANRFYANPDSQYLTVVASPQDQAVVVYEGIDFFDSYQREHKGDEK